MRRRLEEQSAGEDAAVVQQLAEAPKAAQSEPEKMRPYYTDSEAAAFVGAGGQTPKNWVSRGMLKGYRLGGRIVIPRSELDDYRSMAEVSKAIDPTPSREEIIETIRAGDALSSGQLSRRRRRRARSKAQSSAHYLRLFDT